MTGSLRAPHETKINNGKKEREKKVNCHYPSFGYEN
jgi:hypothetical protein